MKKILYFAFLASTFPGSLLAQGVGVNTDGSAPDGSAILDVKASDKGLLVPRVSLTDVTSASPITAPASGLLVYNTNASVTGGSGVGFYVWLGSGWTRLDMSNSGDWRLTGNSGTSPASNFLGTTDAQDLAFRTNNTERMRILSGGNVGMGTAAPSYPLTVERDLGVAAGQQILAGFTRLASGAGNGGLLLGYEGDGSAVARSFIYSTGNQRDLVFQNFDGGLQNRMIIRGTGDVGIGTLTPTHRLHVNGAVRAENGFLANDGTAAVPAFRFTSDTDVGMLRPAANQIGFAMDGIEKVRFNGNAADVLVGINNNSPSAPLDFIRTTSNSMLVGTNYGNAPNYDLRRAQGTVSSPTLLGVNGVIARLRALGYDGTAFQPAAQITFETDAATGSGDMPGRIQFFTTPDGSTTLQERMRITQNGNVGIGTTSPENLLQVARPSAGGNWAALQVTSPGDNSWGHVALLRTTGVGNDGARLLFHSRGIKNWSIGGQENSNNFGIWEDGGDGVYGSGFGTQRLRIEPGGAIFGKFRDVTFHSYNNNSYRAPNTTAETNWLPAPGGDGADDCWDCNLTANGTGFRRGWNAPYNGRLVKIIIRIYGDSGSNPDIQGVVRLHVNGTNFTDTNVFAINDAGVQTITLPATGFSFNAGDRLALGLHKRGNNSDRFEDLDILVTAVWEYDIWD
ncbi:MAG: hypothetical protein NZM15_08505 [Flavobacteriales bacterium]|nr:hypothetical protein [Flavobacteriales bacterium]MDW8432727.1 hypothetical protein [Flavobacteriales bacterium]